MLMPQHAASVSVGTESRWLVTGTHSQQLAVHCSDLSSCQDHLSVYYFYLYSRSPVFVRWATLTDSASPHGIRTRREF
jgi:hypothetical protein